MLVRAGGLLLHITSLPSPYGCGDLGPSARDFATLLAELGQSYWQFLPLCPTGFGNSPYAGHSAFAGNSLLLSPDDLVAEGLLPQKELPRRNNADPRRVDFPAVAASRRALLDKVLARHAPDLLSDRAFRHFCASEAHWLDDWVLFVTLKDHFGGRSWEHWPEPLRRRDRAALAAWQDEAAPAIQRERCVQFLVARQWQALRAHCNSLGVNCIGDLPIYVTYDSADVWAAPQLFQLDDDLRPLAVAGVPPDYFSATGQLWGNPLFAWEAHEAEDFAWWIRRIRHALGQCNALRVDHFRGFAGYWSIPAGEPTAVNGEWLEAPGRELFAALDRSCGSLPLIAEDLGVITAEVRELRRLCGFPGMKIVQFAFGAEWEKHVPHLYEPDCVVYTGTHDNNTVRGWFAKEADREQRQSLARYLGRMPDPEDVHTALIRLAMQSVATTCITPLQDVLGLDASHRMNTPGTLEGNWQWRALPEELDRKRLSWFKEMTVFFDRAR